MKRNTQKQEKMLDQTVCVKKNNYKISASLENEMFASAFNTISVKSVFTLTMFSTDDTRMLVYKHNALQQLNNI